MYGYNLGYNIARQGSKLNYLKWFSDYLTRVEDDGGTVQDDSFSKSMLKIHDKYKLQTDMKLSVIAEGGLKTRDSGVEKYVTTAYDLSDADNDATQTTESSQPFLGGRIAPNEIQNFKSVTGVTKTLTHADIVVSGTYTIIKVLNAEDSGKTVVSFTEVGSGTYNSISWTGRLYAYMIYGGTISAANQALIETDLLNLVKTVESVVIGSQEWSTSNCEMVATPEGNVIPNVTVSADWANATVLYDNAYAAHVGTTAEKEYAGLKAAAMWCYYNNDPVIGAVYGKLYNWYAAKLLDLDMASAAYGWRIPTQAQFETLATTLGGASVAGGKMKVAGTDYWSSPNTGATNKSGFSLIGLRHRVDNGNFAASYDSGSWTIKKIVYYCSEDNDNLSVFTSTANRGWPIRLIKE